MHHWVDDLRIRSHIKRLLEGAGVTRPPVDLDALVQHVGNIDREDSEMGELLGSVERVQRRFKIRVNVSEPHRRRFTLAHEIAHTLLMRPAGSQGRTVRLRVREPDRYDEQEELCNAIAAEILMPYHLFRPRVLKALVNVEAIRRLAKEFDTSVHSTAIRYAHFAEHEMAAIIWKLKEDRLVARATASKPGAHLGGPWADRGLRDVPSGPVHAFHCNHKVVSWETLSAAHEPPQLYCESVGLLSGADRYVLSVVKTGVSQEAFQFSRDWAHRSCAIASAVHH
jgi:Zn-dependent peptidase ImmA (M78 family)